MSEFSTNPSDRYLRAVRSLMGLAIGDGFGQCFFVSPGRAEAMIAERMLPAGQWLYTDDTMMALSVVEVLHERGQIDQDRLAERFVRRYIADTRRGYGSGMHSLLIQIGGGVPWHEAARLMFGGQGSYGNGAAMRVAPLGAYFADDLQLAAEQAILSAEVTHAHPEGIAGAIAVAVAAGIIAQACEGAELPDRKTLLEQVLPFVPESEVRSRIARARNISSGTDVRHVAAMLGNGSQVSAQDTVPLSLWCAGEYAGNLEEALWATVSALGDRDTTCAIVGGIVATNTGIEDLPPAWLESREPLPMWVWEGLGD
ncbi:MAG: ADP-ribosylglycohydrolase family protein [Armatimonadota bacterium]